MKSRIISQFVVVFALTAIFTSVSTAQSNEAEWNGSGYSLKKVVSNTSIQSGVNFSYTILFSAPAGATTVSIQDIIPANLEVVQPLPSPASVCGIVPSLTVSGPLGSQTVNYNLAGLPPVCSASGSFTIVVKFPEGTTCNGESARNRVGIFVNDDWQYTPYVSTTALAADPWKISKSILSGAFVNPSGGSCGYMMAPDDTVKYRIYVMKNSPYYGNVSGQMNMANAVVTDILPAGAVLISSTCGAIQSGNTITWNVNSPSQLLDASVPYAFYYCDFEIYYPVGSFPANSIVNNDATLSGDFCNQQASHSSNQTCIEVLNFTPNLSATFQKYISLANRVPGCSGLYTIVFCNNGNVPLTPFNINDVVPSGVSVNQIKVYNASATTTVDLNINNSPYSTGISSYYDSGTIPSSVNNIQLQMTGSLPVGNCLFMYVYFTIEPNPTGTIVTNCATFDGLSNSLSLPQTCVNFTVDSGTPKPCLLKDICSPSNSYEPGDILRFRLRVQNIGSATITGASFQDNLHSNFNYVGNETYYIASTYNPSCSSGGTIPSGTTPWTGVSQSHSGNNLSWTLPDINSDCQLFYNAYCGAYGTSSLPYYFIEFDVEVDSLALPGVTPNSYDITGGNLPSTVSSNTVNALIVASFGQEVSKEASTDGGSTFSSSGNVAQGGTARFRLKYKNLSNVPVGNIQMVDLLGRNDGSGDWLILNRTIPRGSQFDLTYNLNHATSLNPSGSAPTISLDYSSLLNACLPAYGITLGCNANTWNPSPANNIRMDYGSFNLAPGVTLREDFDVMVPVSAQINQTVCNDFAAISTANFLLNGSPQSVALTPIAAPPICLKVDNSSVSCCDSLSVIQVVDSDGTTKCCLQFSAKCKIDSVKVSIQNGTFSSNSWNCSSPIPTVALGQSEYTFLTNGCAVDLTNCVQASQSGVVIVKYNAFFSNGERCEKEFQIDCEYVNDPCCALVDFKLKHKWPQWNNHIGVFNITNLDPSSPICYVEITPNPAANMSTGSLLIDGVPSTQVWNPLRIPTTGNLSPAAMNSIKFTLLASSYRGSINICIVKCDGTRCCFDVKWNKKPLGHTDIPIEKYNPVGNLTGISISPHLEVTIEEPVKYISFGLYNETEINESEIQFWAVSAAAHEGEAYPEGLANTISSYMGRNSSFFELSQPRMASDGLGIFNLVFANGLPELGCTLFDPQGNVIASGKLDISSGTSVVTSVIIPDYSQYQLFDFIRIYPNPSHDKFNLTVTSGHSREGEIRIVNAAGETVSLIQHISITQGVNEIQLDVSSFSSGMYRVVLSSEGEILSKSAIKK